MKQCEMCKIEVERNTKVYDARDFITFDVCNICEGELFINDDDGETLFNCYYGGSVDSICAIFGIIPEGV